MSELDSAVLKRFLRKAHLFELEPKVLATKEADGSNTITFADGPWQFRDNFFGGDPYGGHEVVHYQGKPVWIMVYYGKVQDPTLEPQQVHDFLFKALETSPEAMPLRGDRHYVLENWEYLNELPTGITHFESREVIRKDGHEVYWLRYMGGLVDSKG